MVALDQDPDLPDSEIDAFIQALADSKVGGSYWADRPRLPAADYTLVRVAHPRLRIEAIKSALTDIPVVWANSGAHATVTGDCDPWHLLEGAKEVIVDACDELALLASIAGVRLRCVGDGPFATLERTGRRGLRDALRHYAVCGWRYVDPFTGGVIGFNEAVSLCRFWRELTESNVNITAAVGFAFWKRPTVAPLLWNGTSKVPFVSAPRRFSDADRVAIWKSRTSGRLLSAIERSGARLIEVEDGFIRSSGLGANCVPPLSILVDRLGIYLDPAKPSELEMLLQNGTFSPSLIRRARQLRKQIVAAGLTKYAGGFEGSKFRRDGRRTILVPGQVEDDRSVVLGGGDVRSNLDLLRRVRRVAPDAYIFYKPHPDVEAGHRLGGVAEQEVFSYADEIVRNTSISSLIASVDEIHVNTSLAGFEGLLRGKEVVTYGSPFYAGWGLTRDFGPLPSRRTTLRTLDELVAAALVVYPRYLDPITRLPCPAEVLVRRLAEGGLARSSGIFVTFRRLQGRLKRAIARLWTR